MALFALYGNFSGVTLIAVNRCIGIVFAHKIRIRRVHAVIMITCSWVYSAMIAGPTTYANFSAVGKYNFDTHHCSPDWKGSDIFNIVCVVLLYGVTVPVMVVSYILIIREIRKREGQVKQFKHTKCMEPKRVQGGNNCGILTPALEVETENNRARSVNQCPDSERGDDALVHIAVSVHDQMNGADSGMDDANAHINEYNQVDDISSKKTGTATTTFSRRDADDRADVRHDNCPSDNIGNIAETVGDDHVITSLDIAMNGKVVEGNTLYRNAEETADIDRHKRVDGGNRSLTNHGRSMTNTKLGTDKRVALTGKVDRMLMMIFVFFVVVTNSFSCFENIILRLIMMITLIFLIMLLTFFLYFF